MRFKQFLESADNNFWVIENPNFNVYRKFATTTAERAARGDVVRVTEKDDARELTYFKFMYDDGSLSHDEWYADTEDFKSHCIPKREADRRFLNGLKEETKEENDRVYLKEAVDLSTLNPGDKVYVTRVFAGIDVDKPSIQHPFFWGDELEFMGIVAGYVEFGIHSELEDETFTYSADQEQFKNSVVLPDEFAKLKRQRDKAFFRGLKEDVGERRFVIGNFPIYDDLQPNKIHISGVMREDILLITKEENNRVYFKFIVSLLMYRDDVEYSADRDVFYENTISGREADRRFLDGLKEDLDFSKLRVGKKFKVQTAFSAKESELGQAHHFKPGERIEFAGSKPWKNGKVIYFFGKKDEFNTHYMFEVPELLFNRSVVPDNTPVKESESSEVEIGQTRIIIGDIIGVTADGLIPLDSGTIKILDIQPRRTMNWVDWKKKDPAVVFTHSEHGNTQFTYMMSQIENQTATPAEKKHRDKEFLKSLKEEEEFKPGDKVWFKKTITAIIYNSIGKLTTAQQGIEFIFYGFEEGFANIGPRWRTKPTMQVTIEDFKENAITEREHHKMFLKGLLDKDE
jgi:hypothetical protein